MGLLAHLRAPVLRLRLQTLDPQDQGWLCDKGRYGYEWVHSEDRVRLVGSNGHQKQTLYMTRLTDPYIGPTRRSR